MSGYSLDEMKALIDSVDWSCTSLGPRDTWPSALEHSLGMCLSARHPTFIYWGPELVQFYNGAGARLCGNRHPAALGRPMSETWYDLWEVVGPELTQVMITGESVLSTSFDLPENIANTTWNERSFSYAFSPIYDDEAIVGAMGVVIETTEAVRQERKIANLFEERTLLAEASRVLADSFDLHATMQHVAELLVPKFADWCQVDLRMRNGAIETVAIAHHDPEKKPIVRRLIGRTHFNAHGSRGASYAIRTGRSDIISSLSVNQLEVAVIDQSEARMYRQLGLGSVLSVPLIVGTEVFGAISVIYGESCRVYTKDDLPLIEEIAQRVAVTVRNLRRFKREQRVAESFQEASLPVSLPNVYGLDFDAVYQAGQADGIVGGDWYDALRLFDGRVVISIGDVAGSGLQAAVTMGNMRQIIRGIAQVHADPALMLDAADRALRLEHPDEYVTAFVGVIDPIARTLCYASAGHPPPFLQLPDGSVEALTDGGLPLGLREGWESPGGITREFRYGSRLVLYTDGLTEYKRDALAGEERLRSIIRESEVFDAAHPAARIHEQFLSGGKSSDDVAILVVSAVAEDQLRPEYSPFDEWVFDVVDANEAQNARHGFCRALAGHGVSPDSIAQAELVFGELVGNVLRYAPGPVQVLIDWSTSVPVLHVLDHGPGYRHIAILPSDIYAESGRGLYLVSALTQDFHVAKRPHGGSHARAVLAINQTGAVHREVVMA
jgi:serine phosphatase RsbU (regulator of sigma subunit)/anti-sigma regulatory factor (Ser/Thr protein kinase)